MDFPARTSEHRRKINVNPSTNPEDGVRRRGGIIESFPDSFRTADRDQSPVRHRGSIQLTPGDPVIRETAGNRARKISPGNERRQVGSAEVRGGVGVEKVFMATGRRKGRKTI